ncbi:amino acid racemase [Negativibacillus massiliensis]|uniref:aspartate/glutamate racemase family protein n=1 Tax=Negativibacillus massiliensis TaxID=1871035 RepID=UPI002A810150|nr:amino acid racemase [Negativibacillus massiliensis]MDY4048369.1 amino acid racemase [Negativibacillus massiliensis]
MNPVIGIIGGMGPLATCDLMQKIIEYTDADTDQEHVRICVDCNTNIPDRTAAILHGGKSPVPELVKSAKRLEAMGAQVLIMSCNTAHYFYDDMIPYLETPFLNMINETAAFLKWINTSKVGVLATDGTRESGIFEKALRNEEIQTVYPSEKNQKLLMSLIYDYIKAGKPGIENLPVQGILDEMWEQGAEKIIMGCTELPILFERLGMMNNDMIDPTVILAQSALRAVGKKLKPTALIELVRGGKLVSSDRTHQAVV